MWDIIIYLLCVIVCIRTVSYGVWCFKNTGITGGVAVMVLAALSLVPLFAL